MAENVAEIAVTPSGTHCLTFRVDSRISPKNFFAQHHTSFRFGTHDALNLVKTAQDELGFTHYKYQQLYKGIKVEGSVLLLHARDGDVVRLNGRHIVGLNQDNLPSITKETALEFALSDFGAELYLWESKAWETEFQLRRNDPAATTFPKAETVFRVLPSTDATDPANYRLAYKFKIHSLTPFDAQAIYVDANTGNIFDRVALMQSAGGTVNTLYNGSQSIITEYRAATDDYILVDDSRGGGIHTREFATGFSAPGIEYVDEFGGNTWPFGRLRVGASAHWAAEMVYDFFSAAPYNWDGYDGVGSELNVFANVEPGSDTYWDAYLETINLSNGVGFQWGNFVSLDIVGHEYMHGIDDNSGPLDSGKNESNTLNESFADIFGTMVEFSIEGGGGDYYLGEDLYATTGRIRNMSNPPRYLSL
ncbi:MAG: M4 family metallopeptidase [Candidatus Marinimicrobia bacterium]|nr:M4 family metallopeptidase [Candidatus Neomarinimicrobiota bacterium]